MNKEIKKLTRSIYTTVAITLVAAGGLFWFLSQSFTTLKVTPAKSMIFLDDKEIKVTGGSAKIVTTPGDHNIRIESDNYIGINEKIKFGRGFAKDIVKTLKEIPKPVEISADASNLIKGSDFNEGYYLTNSGKTLYKMKIGLEESGEIKIIDNRPITDPVLSDIKEIIWSPNKELALLRKSTGDINIFDFKKYDFLHQTETFWGKNIGDVAWSPDNSKIAYYYAPSSGEESLIFANVTNTEITRVANFKQLGINNPLLRWSPDSEWLIIIPRNKNISENKIYLFNTYSRQIKEVTEEGNQVDAVFSPDNNYILYSTYSKDPSSPVSTLLSVMKKDGSDKKSLNIRGQVNKSFWDKDSKTVTVATYNPTNKEETIFQHNVDNNTQTGFVINGLGKIYVDSLNVSDDDKIIIYEADNSIYALKVE